MKILLNAAIAILLFTGFTLQDSGIDGTWKGNFGGAQGGLPVTFEFDVEDDTLMGKIILGPESLELLNGKVDGNTFTFDTDMQGQVISHEATLISADKIEMYISNSMTSTTDEIVLTRAKEKKKK